MRLLRVVLCLIAMFSFGRPLNAQSMASAGALEGVVVDPSGAAVPKAAITLINRLSNYTQSVITDASGAFRITNLPPNPYHLEARCEGFAPFDQDVEVRGGVPVSVRVELVLAGTKTDVTVEAAGSDMLENVPYAHTDVDTQSLQKLPVSSPGSGLSDAVVLGNGAVAADSNGFFHPLGDHAQTSFSIDGQPVSDQQSKAYSTQLPLNAIQSMEMITGAPPAEFGDKTSLVVNAVTKSGLGRKPFGSLTGQWGSFGSYSEEATLGLGDSKLGDFLAVNTLRSGRFLDTPEFMTIHDTGNNGSVFNRLDYQPNTNDSFHLNLFGARNWFQIPNTYDQPGQDQRQKVWTLSIAPGYHHTFGGSAVLSVDSFYRADRLNYYPSRNPFNDTPVTISQARSLTNWGVKSDVSVVKGRHNFKIGTQLMQTRLDENFSFGITGAAFNPVCIDPAGGVHIALYISDPSQCGLAGFSPNPGYVPALSAYDLTRGGQPFQFRGAANVNQYAFYAQDSIKLGDFNVQAGLRVDKYDGLVSDSSVQPRLGVSYQVKPSGTVLRASYSRTFETPYNENLVLSSATGVGGLQANAFGAQSTPLRPGNRNQYEAGFDQAAGRWLVFSANYFWKYTRNAYDFAALLDTPIAFPISWSKSKVDGFSARIGSSNLRGFQWYTTFGHTRARYFGPETGGLIFNDNVGSNSVFRIDHDQAFQQTANLRYQHGTNGLWGSFTWRYDSGMVAGAVSNLEDALALTGAQQAAIGFFCGTSRPSVGAALSANQCTASNYGATRLSIPGEGTANPDLNPSRLAPRHVLDLGTGTDNLFHAERVRTTVRFSVTNLTNEAALYNFLSTFSGTHFLAPRTYQVALGLVF